MKRGFLIFPFLMIIFVAGFFLMRTLLQSKKFSLPKGEMVVGEPDEVKHSIPLEEIISGGVAKDGIPSIDNPQFIDADEASDFLDNSDIGLGIVHKGEARFYPYIILVWHEIVNDRIAGDPILVTYCPLCGTGIVFDPRVDGKTFQFGVSGKLWQSNLLMYNRSEDPDDESLWSQVLGEAVVGKYTGKKLTVLPSDTVRWGDWKKKYPQTKVLSQKTGFFRRYGEDPYQGYAASETVGFGAQFTDRRLHPKEMIIGISINGEHKAYQESALRRGGKITDSFAGETLTLEMSDIGEVAVLSGDGKTLPFIRAFWFSWVAVYPDTALYKQ